MNAPTMIIAAMVAIVFVAIVVHEIKKRKNGQGGCACGCGNCGMKDLCHKKKA